MCQNGAARGRGLQTHPNVLNINADYTSTSLLFLPMLLMECDRSAAAPISALVRGQRRATQEAKCHCIEGERYSRHDWMGSLRQETQGSSSTQLPSSASRRACRLPANQADMGQAVSPNGRGLGVHAQCISRSCPMLRLFCKGCGFWRVSGIYLFMGLELGFLPNYFIAACLPIPRRVL